MCWLRREEEGVRAPAGPAGAPAFAEGPRRPSACRAGPLGRGNTVFHQNLLGSREIAQQMSRPSEPMCPPAHCPSLPSGGCHMSTFSLIPVSAVLERVARTDHERGTLLFLRLLLLTSRWGQSTQPILFCFRNTLVSVTKSESTTSLPLEYLSPLKASR